MHLYLKHPVLGALLALAGCAANARVTFRATDSTFRASGGPPPRVYDAENVTQLPDEPMRSVGRIEISGVEDKARARQLASDKGRELGCWIVVEHSVFEARTPRSAFGGAAVQLVHGTPHVHPVPRKPRSVTAVFDCVVRTDGDRA